MAALRPVRNLESEIPLFQVAETGSVTQIGRLISIHPRSFVLILDATPFRPQYFPDIPFFLDDIRPQGFLGRAFTQKYADLKLPPRILDWRSEDILEALARRGADLTGNLFLGSESFERYQVLGSSDDSNAESYVTLAQAAVDGHPPGSSAGGEQPKFGTRRISDSGEIQKVLVKFSPAGQSFAAERWRDLLICESLALEILREAGLRAVESQILESGGRTFLETVRFDRVGARGRRGILSLAALENQYIGRNENWAASAQELEKQGIISGEDLQRIQKLECFGRLIANTDRHPGNLSFFWELGSSGASLAPVYDMLPMLYAPSGGGEEIRREFSMPTFDHTLLSAWKEMTPWAIRYWERIQATPALSSAFRMRVAKNANLIRIEGRRL